MQHAKQILHSSIQLLEVPARLADMYLQSLLREASACDLFAWGTTLALAYVITTVIYRLYFHPLAKYPGPVLARVSSFPSYWHTLKRDRHIWLWRLQEEYGKHYDHPVTEATSLSDGPAPCTRQLENG
jgi:hypothetical protein